ncbi:EAL domain-containing protein [Xylophilus sp.]|uniref:EAL domain-containing protein n=1 Tax=Xylophilus sp. TaxID=2653893 RepID=UPI0013B7A1E9|nr:EAL domain-containing protein [Xylophilus sp.]KAF1050116.1 MAG: Oxygen sensor protein DosP [Xylophilus sp.]
MEDADAPCSADPSAGGGWASAAVGATDAAVMVVDASWAITCVNPGFTRMLGWTADEVLGRQATCLMGYGPSEGANDGHRSALLAGRALLRERVVSGRDGRRCWARIHVNPIAGPDGTLQAAVSVLVDITRVKMFEALQRRALEAMARDCPPAEVLDLLCREVERIVPEVIASILEVDAQGLPHPLAGPSLPAAYSAALDGVAIGPKVGSCGTAAWRRQPVLACDIATDPLWEDYRHRVLPLGLRACWSTPILSSQGQVVGTFAFYYRDRVGMQPDPFLQQLVDACIHLCALVMEREHTRRRIRQLAFYDGLTGLPNRSLLLAQADQTLAAGDHDGEGRALLFIDIDRFKQVNDSLGHPAGDTLLRIVSRRIQAQLRPSDLAGRLSGDEFVVLLSPCDKSHAAHAAERLQAALLAPCDVAGTVLSCSASVGVAVFPNDGRDIQTLLHRADLALHQAKAGGRGGVRFFSADMNRQVLDRLTLESALREALHSGGLQLHYQPQVRLHNRRLYGVEALARWRHPQFGEIPPMRFVPLAEECGLVTELGHWALDEACRQLGGWRSRGVVVPTVAVNLSATSFHQPDLPRRIAATLARHGLAPRDLILEITESVLLDTHPCTLETINAVHAQGVRLSMDDFGTGYSSLSYLRRLPVSELKLDRSFVADLETDPAAQALSSAILGIGRSLALTVVAEGVETQAQNAILRAQGYPVAQGYLFSQPLPAADFERWLSGS